MAGNPMIRPVCSVVLLVVLLFADHLPAGELKGPAPDFSLENRQGQPVTLSQFQGDVVMINFWASWCKPCREEMPLLDKLYRRYKPMGFTLLGVNVEQNPSAARKLLQEIPVSFPILFDKNKTVSELYNLVAMPSSVFIDRQGRLRGVHHGYKSGDEVAYDRKIKQLIME